MLLEVPDAVAAGSELGIEESIKSTADLIGAASSRFSLSEFLCFSREDAGEIASFELLTEQDDMQVLRRRLQSYAN
jgi:hypothetical protein